MKTRLPPKHIAKIIKIWKKIRNKFDKPINLGELHVYYRISDGGYDKLKPNFITKQNCLKNCQQIFGSKNFNIIADNVKDETWVWLNDDFPEINKVRTKLGSGAKSFNLALDKALKLDLSSIVYFVEDDYVHLPESDRILIEGLVLGGDYVTLYDHPDKYMDTDNPFVDKDGEVTKVFLSKSCHWKLTNSTTMTFGSTVKTLRKDEDILRRWTGTDHPDDFNLFMDLRDRNRSLLSPIPGYSTHGQTDFLSPLVKWGEVLNLSS